MSNLSAERPRLLSVGPSPAWQKVLHFGALAVGEVNRAVSRCEGSGGKGCNLARAAQRRGAVVTLAQFAGGYTADFLTAELERLGIRHLTARTGSQTRVCTTVISDADGTVTELIEPSGVVTVAESQALCALVLAEIRGCEGVALAGTCPPGVSGDFYAAIARAAGDAVLLLDAVCDVRPVLAEGVDIIKVNRAELVRLAERPRLEDAAWRCLEEFGVAAVAVTAGPDAAFLFLRQGAWEYSWPRLSGVRNSTGAGDCVSGVLLAEVAARLRSEATPRQARSPVPGRLDAERRIPNRGGASKDDKVAPRGPRRRPALSEEILIEAFAAGLACACASCLTDLPAEYDPEQADRLRASIRIRRATGAVT